MEVTTPTSEEIVAKLRNLFSSFGPLNIGTNPKIKDNAPQLAYLSDTDSASSGLWERRHPQ